MKIIGGHDYYDSAQAYGHDPKIVFVRDSKVVDNNTFTTPYSDFYLIPQDKLKKQWHWKYKLTSIADRHGRWEFQPVRVIFCGVIYTGIQCVYTKTSIMMSQSQDVQVFWTREDFDHFIDRYFKLSVVYKDGYRGEENFCLRPMKITGEEYKYLIDNRISIAIRDFNWSKTKPDWKLNCDGLKELQFYRVFDAVTAFQELDMWMSGALGLPGAPMVEVSDKYRMEKHGMDKWSFRKKVR